ncbi:hypothetical protein L914_04905 [Phytophthora nicotianae]|uniref:Uncharacterized protein n=1 Tax=Phytophthora nicotianae TaxID=4792 RepID=W2NRD8_PHYNI|nr:hypothetical protein L914_04905 [Phytophthora nicotianae]
MEEHFWIQLAKEQELCGLMPQSAPGTLVYLTVLTRPELATSVRLLVQETETPAAAVTSVSGPPTGNKEWDTKTIVLDTCKSVQLVSVFGF